MKKILGVCSFALLFIPFLATASSGCTYLSFGSSGPAVSALQQFLVAQFNDFPSSYVTGYYGPLTQDAVAQWQSEQGIVSSGSPSTTGYGSVGPRTSAAMGFCTNNTNANTATASAASSSTSLIQSLYAELQTLEAQIAALTGSSATSASSSANTSGQSVVTSPATTASVISSGTVQPLIVGPASRVIVMEYETWFNPLFNPQLFASTAYRPFLTSTSTSVGYDSTDPKVIDQHLQWLGELDVNAVIVDESNGGPCDWGDAAVCAQFLQSQGTPNASQAVAGYTATIHAIDQGAFNLYPAFAQRGTNIKIIPMADGQDPLMFQPRGDGQTPFDVQIAAFQKYITEYPQLSVIYQGKPLLLVYLGAGQNTVDPSSVLNLASAAVKKWQGTFTIRLMTGFVDSQPSLWASASTSPLHEVNPQYQLWSWIDRLNPAYNLYPSYTVAGNRVEAFTVTTAAAGTDASNPWGGDATLYQGGATLSAFMKYADSLDPIFLIYNQFNEFSGPPDEGSDIEHSNDIEPTVQWGYQKFDVAQQALLAYATATESVVTSGPTIASFSVSPSTVQSGQSATVSYAVSNMGQNDFCQILPAGAFPNSNNPSHPGSGGANWSGSFSTASLSANTTLTLSCGGSDTSSASVSVATAQSAVLNTSPASGQAPLSVTFTASSLPSSGSYSVAFGDGQSAQVQAVALPCAYGASNCGYQVSASHVYQSAGTYTATLSTGSCPSGVTCPVVSLGTATVTVAGSVTSNPKTAFISGLYTCVLGRAADPSGLAGWVSEPAGTTLSFIFDSFFDSSEYLAKNTSDQSYVQQLYQCVLGRTGSSTEVAGWVSVLQGTTRDSLLNSFVTSQEFVNGIGATLQAQTGWTLGPAGS